MWRAQLGILSSALIALLIRLLFLNTSGSNKHIMVMWTASLCMKTRGAGFAYEAVDFLIPLSDQVTTGWYTPDDCPLTYPTSVIPTLSPPEQQIFSRLFNQGLYLAQFYDQILVLQFQPPQYDAVFKAKPSLRRYEYKIGRVMFETTSLPSGWVDKINEVLDEVWVPNVFNKAVLLNEGVTKPIVVIYEGFDQSVFTLSRRDGERREETRRRLLPMECWEDFIFIAVAKFEDRKGFDVLIRAVEEEFSSTEDVCLLIRSTGLDNVGLSRMRRYNNSKIFGLDNFKRDTYVDVLEAADVFVLPTHGEGWGRPVMEAMATGLPTIATYWSGLAEMLDPRYSILLNVTDLDPAFPREPHIIAGGTNHKWARVDKDSLRGAMRWAERNREEMKRMGERARRVMHKRFSRDVVISSVVDRLKVVYGKIVGNRGFNKSLDINKKFHKHKHFW